MSITSKLHNEVATVYRTIIFGFDQSYAGTGIAIVGKKNNKEIDIIHCESINGIGEKLEFRKHLQKRIRVLMREYRSLGDRCYALCETMRSHSEGTLSINNHLSWGALQGCIADCLYQSYGIELRRVDTRMWKARVIGTSKPAEHAPKGVDPKKWPTIQYMLHVMDVPKQQLAKQLPPRTRNYTWLDKNGDKFTYDSDIADACGIALCGFKVDIKTLRMAV